MTHNHIFFIVSVAIIASATRSQDLCDHKGPPGPVFFEALETETVGHVVGKLDIHGSKTEIELEQVNQHDLIALDPATREIKLISDLHTFMQNVSDPVNNPPVIALNIRCIVKASNKQQIIPVKVEILDVNDNAPYFLNTPYFSNISEMTLVGYTIFYIHAADNDFSYPNNFIYFEIEQGPFSDYVALPNEYEGKIVLRKQLDFREFSFFFVTVKVLDSGNPSLFDSENITVWIVDEDNLNPVFRDTGYTAEMLHTSNPGMQLLVKPRPILAEDQDKGVMSPITYTIEYGDAGYFIINNSTADVFLSKPVKIGMQFAMLIKATELYNGDHYASTSLTVKVRRQNENKPQFDQLHYKVSVMENVPIGSTVLRVSAHDADQDPTMKLMYSIIEGNQADDFKMNDDGLLLINHKLQYTRTSEYWLTARVTDGKFSDEATVRVVVVNTNNQNPVFQAAAFNFEAERYEDTFVGQIMASDPSGQRLTYKVLGYDKYFTITNKGQLYTTKYTKELKHSEYHLTVKACNEEVLELAEEQRCSVALVTVNLPQILPNTVKADGVEQTSLIIALAVIASIMLITIIIMAVMLLKQNRALVKKEASRPPEPYSSDSESILECRPGKEQPSGLPNAFYPSGVYNNVVLADAESSDQSERSLQNSSTEHLYKNTQRNRNNLSPNGISVSREKLRKDDSPTDPKKKKHVTIGGTEEVDDWGGEHPQTDSQVETILDPNVSVEPLYDYDDTPVSSKPDLTIYF